MTTADTPKTDALIVSQSFVDETRLFDRCHYIPLLDLARALERSNASLLETLGLVRIGLSNGSIKSKAVMTIDHNAESMEMQSLEEIVDAAINRANP